MGICPEFSGSRMDMELPDWMDDEIYQRRKDAIYDMQEDIFRKCKDCIHYANFLNICTNGRNKNMVSYISEDGYCEEWEAVESE